MCNIANLKHAMWTQHIERHWNCASYSVSLRALFGKDQSKPNFCSITSHYTWRYRDYGFSLSNSVVHAHLNCYVLLKVATWPSPQVGIYRGTYQDYSYWGAFTFLINVEMYNVPLLAGIYIATYEHCASRCDLSYNNYWLDLLIWWYTQVQLYVTLAVIWNLQYFPILTCWNLGIQCWFYFILCIYNLWHLTSISH